ncbi:NAD-dependent epimerase/dehydratase family protein [Streptomyces bambusae]|uniref:NAD-dependent epimerase/dehydratase family protein n=1 Tax=Streptomyces bambusae TaxID=1550616 RepID=UPI001D0019AD|nr:NAD-dependent epimerase/dehydratase family protein [Streptomyces bambusae]MCB5169618.1 NAD-dependent epimerase/dehydratase family protein [Streptomyces bambusae]
MPTVLISGAAGFVGRHVVREAGRHRASLRLMSHHRPVGPSPHTVVRADLAAPASLHGVCEGVDVLIHCAARIGGSDEANEAVNARGTAALVAEARRAGVRRIVHLSTASVYGRGTFRGGRPAELTRNPRSATSRTRAAAEDAVLAAGGTVLRPHLVYGVGDVWVLPGLAGLLRALPGGVAGWTAAMSLVSATDLARLLVASALAPAGTLTESVYHAVHPAPVAAYDLLRAAAACTGAPWPQQRQITADRARSVLRTHREAAYALDLMTSDHVFDGAPLWRELRLAPGPCFGSDFPRLAGWYRTSLVTAA